MLLVGLVGLADLVGLVGLVHAMQWSVFIVSKVKVKALNAWDSLAKVRDSLMEFLFQKQVRRETSLGHSSCLESLYDESVQLALFV